MKIWTEPKVSVLSRPQFIQPEHLPVEWADDMYGTCEELIEYAGRLCYMSQHNPAKKTTRTYIENILEMGHGSVLEHANFTLLLEGISRSCSHEIVRHRAGCAYSQLSQRFVEHPEVVRPPLYDSLTVYDAEEWASMVKQEIDLYEAEIVRLKSFGIKGKPLRETARSLLPNATETKITMTANARAWRHILEMRCSPHADAEIRRLFLAVLEVLRSEAPALFGDFSEEGVPKWSKV